MELTGSETAVVLVDFQNDFCKVSGTVPELAGDSTRANTKRIDMLLGFPVGVLYELVAGVLDKVDILGNLSGPLDDLRQRGVRVFHCPMDSIYDFKALGAAPTVSNTNEQHKLHTYTFSARTHMTASRTPH